MLLPAIHDSIFNHGYALAFWTAATHTAKFAFDAAVGAMEAPGVNGAPETAKYRWWFKFLNRMAANIRRADRANGINGHGTAADGQAAGGGK